MKRIIPMALISLTLLGGVALADRGRWRDHRSDRVIAAPTHRSDRWDGRRDNRRYDDRRYDNRRHDRVVSVHRVRPTFRNNRFYFAGGHYQHYQRPVIQYRYRNYYQRPALIVENVQPVAGYIWTPGQWQWDGYEWQWIPGHYDVDTSDQDSYYDGYQEPVYNYQAPAVQGGIQVQGSWNF